MRKVGFIQFPNLPRKDLKPSAATLKSVPASGEGGGPENESMALGIKKGRGIERERETGEERADCLELVGVQPFWRLIAMGGNEEPLPEVARAPHSMTTPGCQPTRTGYAVPLAPSPSPIRRRAHPR